MARPPPDPEKVALAQRLVRAGHTRPAVAEAMHVRTSTIDRWLRLPCGDVSPRPPPDPAPPDPAPPPEGAGAAEDDGDVLSLLREEIRELRKARREATRVHDPSAKTYSAVIAKVAPLLARLEAASRRDEDGVWISRAEIERVKQEYAERVRKVLALGPLTCAACGARIRRENATQ